MFSNMFIFLFFQELLVQLEDGHVVQKRMEENKAKIKKVFSS